MKKYRSKRTVTGDLKEKGFVSLWILLWAPLVLIAIGVLLNMTTRLTPSVKKMRVKMAADGLTAKVATPLNRRPVCLLNFGGRTLSLLGQTPDSFQRLVYSGVNGNPGDPIVRRNESYQHAFGVTSIRLGEGVRIFPGRNIFLAKLTVALRADGVVLGGLRSIEIPLYVVTNPALSIQECYATWMATSAATAEDEFCTLVKGPGLRWDPENYQCI